jgi:predicted acetyltransferase
MLVVVRRSPANIAMDQVPAYVFDMRHILTNQRMGGIDLRLGESYNLRMYGGQVGYGVDPVYRGQHYAARSVRLLLPLARRHGFGELWITCNPDNYASRRTCELAGAKLIEVVPVPEDLDLYQEGEREKCRYLIEL